MKWKDISSFSQGDKQRIPYAWECQPHADLRITITRGHIDYPGKWVMHCYPWFTCRELKADPADLASAQAIAMELVRDRVAAISAALAA